MDVCASAGIIPSVSIASRVSGTVTFTVETFRSIFAAPGPVFKLVTGTAFVSKITLPARFKRVSKFRVRSESIARAAFV